MAPRDSVPLGDVSRSQPSEEQYLETLAIETLLCIREFAEGDFTNCLLLVRGRLHGPSIAMTSDNSGTVRVEVQVSRSS